MDNPAVTVDSIGRMLTDTAPSYPEGMAIEIGEEARRLAGNLLVTQFVIPAS